MWETGAAKDPNRVVVRLMVMKSIKRGRVVGQRCSRESIKQRYGSGETVVPKM
jgi:hypothetical protein